MQRIFRKIIEGVQVPFSIFLRFSDKNFELTVLQGANAWKTHVAKENLNDLAGLNQTDLENYYENLLEYLQKPLSEIEISFSKSELVVFRKLEQKMRQKFFTVKLDEISYADCTETLLGEFYEENRQLTTRLDDAEHQITNLKLTQAECDRKFADLLVTKQRDEEALYGKFLLVLNEKKFRIQHLTELLDALKEGRALQAPTSEIKRRKRKKAVAALKETVSSSSSEQESVELNDYQTDDEIKEEPNPVPSTSTNKELCNYLNDDVNLDCKLPKRVRRTENELATTVLSQNQNVISKLVNSNNVNIKVNKKVEKEAAPVVDFSTQDLLDNI